MSTSSRTISPLRQRMIDDMTARQLGDRRSGSISAAANGLPPSLVARPRARRPKTFAASSCTWRRATSVSAIATPS